MKFQHPVDIRLIVEATSEQDARDIVGTWLVNALSGKHEGDVPLAIRDGFLKESPR